MELLSGGDSDDGDFDDYDDAESGSGEEPGGQNLPKQQRCITCNDLCSWVCARCTTGPNALVPCHPFSISARGKTTQHRCLGDHRRDPTATYRTTLAKLTGISKNAKQARRTTVFTVETKVNISFKDTVRLIQSPLAPRVVPDSFRISSSGGSAACLQSAPLSCPAVSQIRVIAPAVIGAAGKLLRDRTRVITVASNVLHVPGKRVGRARAKTCQPSHACLFPVFQSLK